jgi:hypothetical protein
MGSCAPLPQENSDTPVPYHTPFPTNATNLSDSVVVVSGTVISGGDQTPSDLTDAPRTFEYAVETEDLGKIVVSYTAYPPSPVGDSSDIELDFHAGEILVGDYLVATGRFDKQTQTLYVEETGHYIKTFSEKP